jgi:acetyl-CoA acetyltransferase
MRKAVTVAGVGMVPFTKPGAGSTYDVMASDAIRLALVDARIDYTDIQQAYAGYVYGDSTAGQRVLYKVGMTGIPIVNVNNNCATGSTALFLARQAVASGAIDCALVVGFEQMKPGAIGSVFTDRPTPFDRFDETTGALVGEPEIPLALRYFGGAGLAHMREFGTRLETFAMIRAKASRHAVHNPMSVFRKEMTVDDVMNAPMVWPGVMTRPMACPPTCGAAAAVICSPAFASRRGIDASVSIIAQSMATDRPDTFDSGDMRRLVGVGMTEAAARSVYEQASIGPEEIDVLELHDCFAQNELITYEGLGLCGRGEAEKFVVDGDNTYGGKYVVNPSGGLLSKGHPLGATGLAQCVELVQQLRGTAGARQVQDARWGLQHNLGLGGACVVTLYQRTS